MKAPVTRIVVADGFRARFFDNQGIGRGIRPSDPAELSTPHPPSHEIASDRPGATHDRTGEALHAYAPRTDPKGQEKLKFVAQLGKLLTDQAGRGTYDRLVLVADPKTLGQLRDELGKAATGRIHAELNKDLTQLTEREIVDHLTEIVAL